VCERAGAPNSRDAAHKADRKLAVAQRLLETGDWEDASSRSYCAVFHPIYAVLWSDGKTYSSHAKTLGTFINQSGNVLSTPMIETFAKAD
jgi:uncharacterized protein (UPF0332 family)